MAIKGDFEQKTSTSAILVLPLSFITDKDRGFLV